MPSKKYYTDLEKSNIYTIENIKVSIIKLKHDITKIHQNLKNILWEIYYLYDDIKFSESFEEFEESNDCADIYKKINHPKKKKVQSRYVKIVKVKDNWIR